jgi:sugar phosphate isomerase/epimerase
MMPGPPTQNEETLKMNKLGFRTCGFSRLGLSEGLAAIKRAGYDGAELCFECHELLAETSPNRPVVREAVKAFGAAGLEIASFSFHGDGEPLPRRWKRTAAVIEAAGDSGVGVLIINAPRIVPGKKERQFADLVARWKKLARQAERAGVRLAVEPEPYLIIEGGEDMLRAIDEVGSKALCVNLDVGHAWIVDQDVPAYIQVLRKRIVHTHFEDIAGKVHRHLVPGEGQMPLPKIVAALREVGYAGYLTVDLFAIHDAPEDFARRAYAGLRAALA